MCCTDYDVICVYRGVFRGYLVDIAVSFCSYWSKMEYMSILRVQLWHGVLSSMLSNIAATMIRAMIPSHALPPKNPPLLLFASPAMYAGSIPLCWRSGSSELRVPDPVSPN